MGCGPSKQQETPLVRLCRERRDLILSVARNRFALAAAYSAYVRSMAAFGDSVQGFVTGGFVPDAPGSPVLRIPGDRKSSKADSSSTSLSHTLSDPSPSDSHLHFELDESETKVLSPEYGSRPIEASPSSPVRESSIWSFSPAMNYVKSTAIPAMVFAEPTPWSPKEKMIFGEPSWRFSEPQFDPAVQSPLRSSPPPSPPKASSGWDFLNPFVPLEEYSYYPVNRNSSGSSVDSAEVRRQEGIPDLEDESLIAVGKEVEKEQRHEVAENKDMPGDNASSSGHIMIDEDDYSDSVDDLVHDLPSERSNTVASLDANGSAIDEVSANHKKGVSFGEVTSVQDGESSKGVGLVATLNQGTRDILDVLKEIKDDFESVSESVIGISETLEVGKLPYRSKTALIRAKMLLLSSISVSRMPTPRISDPAEDMNFNGLSTILEKIYMWESKLFVEVKEEEKMRLMYEKKFKKLKMLDRKGAEVDQVQSTQLSIRKQLTKISMSIKSIDAVSNKIHGIRDTELQSQLTKLIHGMMQMWEVLLACHKKQLQAISEGKTLDIISRSASRDSAIKATMQLEQGASSWSSSFLNWMKAQRAYVESLNCWLSRCITDQEPEVTEDGVVPFSPGRIGAPPIFVICNDWCQMMKRVSGDQVLEAIDTFAANMHGLWEQLDQERLQSLENEHLSKDLNRMVRLLQQDENNMQIQRLANTVATSVTEDFETSLADRKMALDETKRRLDEGKQKHADMVRQVEVGTFTMLKTGLVRIFEAMVDFANSNIKAYEDIRMPNGLDT